MKRFWISLILFTFCYICPLSIICSTVTSLSNIRNLIEDRKYYDALDQLNLIEKDCLSDTSVQTKADFNLCKGSVLYFVEEYSNAIPYLLQAEQYMEFDFNSGDCNYLETLYGIASCYTKLGDYDNAEKYYRKAIITDETQSFACDIMKQLYTDMIDLYRSYGKTSLADECIHKFEEYNKKLFDLKTMSGTWQEQVRELSDDIPNFEDIIPQQREMIVKIYNSILGIIESNDGKYNEDFILYCSRYEKTLQYRINDTISAIDICEQMFDIGRKISEYNKRIADAYADYLDMVSCNSPLNF